MKKGVVALALLCLLAATAFGAENTVGVEDAALASSEVHDAPPDDAAAPTVAGESDAETDDEAIFDEVREYLRRHRRRGSQYGFVSDTAGLREEVGAPAITRASPARGEDAIEGEPSSPTPSSASPSDKSSLLFPPPRMERPPTPPPPPPSPTSTLNGFVRRAGTRFVVQKSDADTRGDDLSSDKERCENFYFVGTNNYYLMVRAADPRLRCEVLEVLDAAAAVGVSVIRTWGFSDGAVEWNALQREPGVYNERTFVGMDYVLHQAAARGLRLLIAFGNYWQHYGGVDAYNRWSYRAGKGTCDGAFACRDEFFSDPYARRMYKDHIRAMVTRRNTYTGVMYRDDPAIFGWNLMNEPRSTADLVTVERTSSDSDLAYNVSSNSGDALQDWIEDMAAYVKSIDPVHLLTVGEEGFFGPSTPLYLYANPGPWAQLEGVDFVRNHRAPGIDFASMHVYVDQWLCTERGKDKEGRDAFFMDWLNAHQQAAEEELAMPVILEEFGGKLEERLELYRMAFDNFYESALRGGSGGGVMFWILYHNHYAPLDRFGGGYGNYLELPESTLAQDAREQQAVLDLVKRHSKRLEAHNSAKFFFDGEIYPLVTGGASSTFNLRQGRHLLGAPLDVADDVCYWTPPVPKGEGCGSIKVDVSFGGMPWRCLPGEAENVSECAPRDDDWRQRLYREPPVEWRASGRPSGQLPYNTVESLVMPKITNRGRQKVNLRGGWFVIPFSRGIHTKYEGEWERMEDPNRDMTVMCWYAGIYVEATGQFAQPYRGDLCRTGQIAFSFTTHAWPEGTKADRGLNVSFPWDLWLDPGHSINAGGDGWNVGFSFKDGAFARRLDVSSLLTGGALSCPSDPNPPVPWRPDASVGCDHPWRACPAAAAKQANRGGVLLPGEIYPLAMGSRPTVMAMWSSAKDMSQRRRSASYVSAFTDVEVGKQYLVSVQVRVTRTYDDDDAWPSVQDSSRDVSIMELQQHNHNTGNQRSLLQEQDFSATSSQSPAAIEADERKAEYEGGGRAANAEEFPDVDDVQPTDAPNPEERRTNRIKFGPEVIAIVSWDDAEQGKLSFETLAVAEAPVNEWTWMRGVISFNPLPGAAVVPAINLYVEVAERGFAVETRDLRAVSPTEAAPWETQEYVPCQIDPAMAPDAIYAFSPDPAAESFDVDVKLCSRGYSQTMTVYEDGVAIRTATAPPAAKVSKRKDVAGVLHPDEIYAELPPEPTCGLGDTLASLRLTPGRSYHLVIDGQHGFPYGSFRGGAGVRVTRRDGRGFPAHPGGFDAAVNPERAKKAVRALGTRFVVGGDDEGETCAPFAYAGANVWDLMDTARYPTIRWRVDEKLDGLKREGVNVIRTWQDWS